MFRDLTDDPDEFSGEADFFLDVPFVPTDDAVIRIMLQMAGIGRKDLVYDLGAGDGRIVIAAAQQRGARAIGIEIDPLRIADAMEAAGDAGVEHLVDFIEDDLFDADISDASVVTLYLLDSINKQLRPRLLAELRPGTRIVSHAFGMGDWHADAQRDVGGISIYKWIVPGPVAGTWDWEAFDGTPYQAEFIQKYQEVSASVWRDGQPQEVEQAQLSGNRLELGLLNPENGSSTHFTLHFQNGRLESVEEYD